MNVVSPGSQTDLNRLVKISAEIESNLQHPGYRYLVTNDIGYYQPFLLYIFNQYEEEEALTKLYYLLWFFYRRKIRVRDMLITSERFMQAEYDIADIFVPGNWQEEKLYDHLESPGSRALITTILEKFSEDGDFKKLLTKSDNAVFISVCSFIRCFDEITTKRWPK